MNYDDFLFWPLSRLSHILTLMISNSNQTLTSFDYVVAMNIIVSNYLTQYLLALIAPWHLYLESTWLINLLSSSSHRCVHESTPRIISFLCISITLIHFNSWMGYYLLHPIMFILNMWSSLDNSLGRALILTISITCLIFIREVVVVSHFAASHIWFSLASQLQSSGSYSFF